MALRRVIIALMLLAVSMIAVNKVRDDDRNKSVAIADACVDLISMIGDIWGDCAAVYLSQPQQIQATATVVVQCVLLLPSLDILSSLSGKIHFKEYPINWTT